MVERDIVMRQQTITYKGPLEVAELYKFIDDWLDDHRYDRRDMDHNEAVKPEGKFIEVSLRPWLGISDYAKFVLWIDLKLSGIKDIEVEIDGHKRKLQEGEVWIGFKAFLDTDTEARWESNPLYMVIRTAFNRFIYSSTIEMQTEELKRHVTEFREQMKSFLNLYRKRAV